MASILITGGSGFIGTNLVEHYLANGSELLSLDIARPRNSRHMKVWREVDILDSSLLSRTIVDFSPAVIFHLAARTDLDGRKVQDYSSNVEGVANLIAAVRACRSTPFVVFASSMLVCRTGYQPAHALDYCPHHPYGASKVAAEQLVRQTVAGDFPWVIVRPTSIWGPWFGTPYRDFFEMIAKGFYFHPRGRRIRRSYGFVLNSVFQLERIAAQDGGALVGHTVYLADYEPIELKHWANTIQTALNSRPVFEIPLWILGTAAKVGDVLKHAGYRNPPISSFRLNNLLTEVLHDTTALRETCGDTPHSMEDGVRITCDWLRHQPN